MENKQKLIDTKILLDIANKMEPEKPGYGRKHIDSKGLRYLAEKCPAVDAVPVVRCKDCKYWHEGIGWCDQHSQFDEDEWNMFDADDFCSYGIRKEN